jgi:hypothetical protein
MGESYGTDQFQVSGIGIAGSTDIGVAVQGSADVGVAVKGYAAGGIGVYGQSAANMAAIIGQNFGADENNAAPGVYGESGNADGVYGITHTSQHAGVSANNDSDGGVALGRKPGGRTASGFTRPEDSMRVILMGITTSTEMGP